MIETLAPWGSAGSGVDAAAVGVAGTGVAGAGAGVAGAGTGVADGVSAGVAGSGVGGVVAGTGEATGAGAAHAPITRLKVTARARLRRYTASILHSMPTHTPAFGRPDCGSVAPALLVNQLGQRQPATGPQRPCQVLGVSRVAKAQDVAAVPLVGVAQHAPAQVLLVNRRRH